MSTSRPPEIPAVRAPSNGRARARYVQVAVNAGRPTFQTFSYRVPPDRQVLVGEVVHVPWGQRTLQGVVIEGPTEFAGYSGEIRDIEPAVAGAPVLSPERLALAAWIADYYLAPQWESYALMLPPGAGERPQTVVVRGPKADKDIQDTTMAEQKTGYDLKMRSKELYGILVLLTNDEAKRIVKGVPGDDGLAAWQSLARTYGRASVAKTMRMMKTIINPKKAKDVSEVVKLITDWETKVKELEKQE